MNWTNGISDNVKFFCSECLLFQTKFTYFVIRWSISVKLIIIWIYQFFYFVPYRFYCSTLGVYMVLCSNIRGNHNFLRFHSHVFNSHWKHHPDKTVTAISIFNHFISALVWQLSLTRLTLCNSAVVAKLFFSRITSSKLIKK